MGRTGVLATSPARLRAARDAARLTQEELAAKVGARDANVRAWESGRRRPEVYTLRRLAEALGVDVLDLLEPTTPVDLRALRIRVGRTQEDVAQLAGLTRGRYQQIERGERGMTDEETAALAAALSDPDAHIHTTVDQVHAARAAGGTDWPTPSRPVELPGDLAARVAEVRHNNESFAAALTRIVQAGLDADGRASGSDRPA